MFIPNQNNINFHAALTAKEQLQKGAQIVTKPIDKVEDIVTNTVDTFVPVDTGDEETKKSHKTAIRVVSTVLVLSALIPFLNPKFSSKMITKMKTLSAKYAAKGKNSDSIMGKIYRGAETGLEKGAKVLNFTNNWNTFKDGAYRWLCDKTKILKKPNEWITKGFDKISKQTVFGKYERAKSSFGILDNAILHYKVNLPKEDAAKIDKLLEKAIKQQEYFSGANIEARLKHQEDLMSNLEEATVKQMKDFANGFRQKEGKMEHLKKNFRFWAEDLIMPQKNQVEKDGLKAIQEIIGDGKTGKGTYNEILEIITPHLKNDEKTALEEMMNNAAKKLTTANKTECTEYFDKKRDLVLGSAPTDVLTALFGLASSGIAIGTADTKEDKVSRSVTVAFPAIAGLGVSMAMTAMLYSGIKGMIIGALSSGALSLTGSSIDKYIIRKKKPEEVKNA